VKAQPIDEYLAAQISDVNLYLVVLPVYFAVVFAEIVGFQEMTKNLPCMKGSYCTE
jgi:hypothetical protein